MATSHPPSSHGPRRFAVIGAGLSGLAAANALAAHGHRVEVFDKARGPGGRMSTRREAGLQFDHGAQYFTVRDPRFSCAVSGWQGSGLTAPWKGRLVRLENGRSQPVGGAEERWVGVPGMNAVGRHLADRLEVRYRTRVASVDRGRAGWRLLLDGGGEVDGFDALVVSAPAPQTAELLAGAAPVLAAAAAAVPMAPCWAVMVAFERALPLGFDGAFVHRSPLSWIARDASKPGRPAAETWVLHGGPEWSREALELEPSEATAVLLDAFRDATGLGRVVPTHAVAHRWRFALPPEPLPEPCLADPERAVAACGDWCGGPRVEGAYLSGLAAAARLVGIPVTERA